MGVLGEQVPGVYCLSVNPLNCKWLQPWSLVYNRMKNPSPLKLSITVKYDMEKCSGICCERQLVQKFGVGTIKQRDATRGRAKLTNVQILKMNFFASMLL